MKRIWWIAKMVVLVAAMYCIFSPGGSVQRVRADEGGGGCNTSQNCWETNDSRKACYCPISGTGCSGCYKPNGSDGCGTCATKGEMEIQ